MKEISWHRPVYLVCALMTLCGVRAPAQAITPGSRVRVISAGVALPTEGLLVAMTSDSISLHLGMSSTLVSLPMDRVRAVDLSHGRFATFGKVVRDGAIGFVVGVGVVALGGKAVCANNGGYCGVDATLDSVR